MIKLYCSNCLKKVEYTTREKLTKDYQGLSVTVSEKIAVCCQCKKDIAALSFRIKTGA